MLRAGRYSGSLWVSLLRIVERLFVSMSTGLIYLGASQYHQRPGGVAFSAAAATKDC